MLEPLYAYIHQYTNSVLNEAERAIVAEIFKIKKLRKKQYFLQAGDVCTHIGFVLKGALRQYSVDEEGKEHVMHLYIENYWTGDRESSVLLTPSVYNIDAWEDSELALISRAEMIDLMARIPTLTRMFQTMDEKNAIANQRRLNSAISNSAEKRYEEFTKSHPHFMQRFPQHIIASYLGITKETLSRIRKQSMK